MDLREFSQSGGYSTAILTTYEFDPVFFERIVLRDLIVGGVRTVIVLADSERAVMAVNRMSDDLLHLGRRYQLIPVFMQGAFHPKLSIKIDDHGALVACGSANLTQPGWLGRRHESHAGNREIASAWQVVPKTSQAADLIRVLGEIRRLSSVIGQLVDSIIDQFSWLSENHEGGDSSLLISSAEEPLCTQILRKLQGRRYNRVVIQTGSTDKVGAFLRWLHEQFGIQSAIVELDPRYSIFDPQALGTLPFEVRVRQSPTRPRLHAKIVVLEGDKENTLIYGSANCSSAAWLLPLNRGGNSEAVVCLDRVDASALEDVIDLSDSDTVLSTEVQYSGNSENNDQGEHTLHIVHAFYSPDSNLLSWIFSKPVDMSQIERCEFGEQELVPRATCDKSFQADFSGDSLNSEVQFISMVVNGVGVQHWVDHQGALDQFRDRSRNFPPPPKSPADPDANPKEVMDGLRTFAKWILDYDIQDRHGQLREARAKRARKDNKVPERKLTVDDIVGSMDDRKSRSSKSTQLGSLGTLSLQGIIGIVLGAAEVDNDEDDGDSYTREHSNERDTSSGTNGRSQDKKSDRQISLANRKRLLGQIQRFIKSIESDDFAQRCTVEQLQQAISLPLVIATACLGSDWVENTHDREQWVNTIRTTVELAVTRKCLNNSDTILSSVITRHFDIADIRQKESIGDGVLLVLFLAAIEACSTDFDDFERLLLMHDIHQSLALLTSGCDSERITLVSERLRVPSLHTDWRKRAGAALENANALQESLAKMSLVESGVTPSSKAQVGNWMWHPTNGFAVITEVEMPGKVSMRFRNNGNEIGPVYIRSRGDYKSQYRCLGDLEELRRYFE